jgi:hypothetical protein
MKSPNKMIGGIAGAMAQQTGALDGTTNLGVQPGQMQQNLYPDQNALGSAQNQIIPAAYGGAQAPGTAFRMEDDSPLEGNAFIGALEAAKAGGEKSFNVNGKTYPVK